MAFMMSADSPKYRMIQERLYLSNSPFTETLTFAQTIYKNRINSGFLFISFSSIFQVNILIKKGEGKYERNNIQSQNYKQTQK